VWARWKVEKASPDRAGLSTVGEPVDPKLLHARAPSLVLFGGRIWTEIALSQQQEMLEKICRALDLKKIITIGTRSECAWHGSVPLEQTGVLAATDVSEILQSVQVGYLDYFPKHLGKSSIYAAYCAHGLLSVFPLPMTPTLMEFLKIAII